LKLADSRGEVLARQRRRTAPEPASCAFAGQCSAAPGWRVIALTTIDEAADLRDKAAARAAYAKRRDFRWVTV